MSIKLFNGLLDSGGILTETYYRKTRATAEAKEALGYSADDQPNASIGIASVEELINRTTAVTAKNASVILVTATNEQAVILDSIYSSNPKVDAFDLILFRNVDEEYYRQRFTKTQQITILPKLVVPTGHQLVAVPKSGDMTFTVNLRPCAILPLVISGVSSEEEESSGTSRDS